MEVSLESFLGEDEAQFRVLPISDRDCTQAAQLPATYPKDPADRIIGATALAEGIALITADLAIGRSYNLVIRVPEIVIHAILALRPWAKA